MEDLREAIMLNQFISVTGCPRDQAEKVLSSYQWQLQPALSEFMDHDFSEHYGISELAHDTEKQLTNADNKGRLKRIGEMDSDPLPKSKRIKMEYVGTSESTAPANTPSTPPNLSDALSMLSQMSTEDFQVSPRQIPISPKLPAWLPSDNGGSPQRNAWFEEKSDPPNNNDCDLYSPPKSDTDEGIDQFDLELEIEATAF